MGLVLYTKVDDRFVFSSSLTTTVYFARTG